MADTGYASNVEEFNNKWRQLAQTTKQLGIPDAVGSAVYEQDLKRLQTAGDYAQSGDQLLQEIKSAATGKPTTGAPPGNPADVVGNVGTDVKDFGVGLFGLIKSAVSDVVKPVADVVTGHPGDVLHGGLAGQLAALGSNPKVLEDPVKAAAGLFDPAHWTLGNPAGAKFVQSVGNSPLLSVIPGTADVAKVSEGQKGVDSLLEHPFTSLLDLAPYDAGAGSAARSLAKVGVSDSDRTAIEEAAQYKPTDVSPEARAARSAAARAVPGYLRRTALMNPGGILSLMNQMALQLPFGDDNVGSWLAHKINVKSAGQLGPVAASIGRMLVKPGHEHQLGIKEVLDGDVGKFYERYGITDTKSIQDFSWLLTHYREDWQTAYAGQFDADEIAKFGPAVADYDARVDEYAAKDLAKQRLAAVTDPRTGRMEFRATAGEDAGVVAKHMAYTKAFPAFQEAAFKIASLVHHDISLDNAKLDMGRGIFDDLSPIRPYMDERYDDPANLKESFPAPPRASSAVPYKVASLFGAKGKFKALERALQKGDMRTASTLANQINIALKLKYVDRNPLVAGMREAMGRDSTALKAWKTKSIEGAITKAQRARDGLTDAIDKHPAAPLQPRRMEFIQDRLVAHLAKNKASVTAEDYNLLYDQIKNGIWNGAKFEDIVGTGEMTKIQNSALKALSTERDQGLEPKFIYSTNARDLERVGSSLFDLERIQKPRSIKSRGAINTSAIYDPIIGLTVKASEDLREQVMEDFFYGEHGFLQRFAVNHQDALNQAALLAKDPPSGSLVTKGMAIQRYVEEHYTEIDPEHYIPRKPGTAVTARPSTPTWVPNDVKDALEATLKSMQGPKNPILRTYAHGTNVFRVSLLNFSPRYQVHIYAGGTVLLMLRSDPISIAKSLAPAVAMMARDSDGLVKAISDKKLMAPFRPVFDHLRAKGEQELARRGETGGLPVELAHGVAEGDPTLVNGYKWATGNKLGEWYKEIAGKSELVSKSGEVVKKVPFDAGLRMATFGANMLRSMAYLIGEGSEGDREAGIEFANKVFADMGAMTPIERSIIRYVMPFYGWTRHILQYVATYPLDHPYRAAVLSQMINQEWEDWNSGFPQSLMYLFQIGGTDANGNATTIDLRQLDPLRSVDDVFTMAGFLSSLNPALQTAIGALGINTQTGQPANLYPTLTLNDFYGDIQDAPETVGSILGNGIGQYIPESSVLDHFLSMSSYTKWAKANDPNAYANQLYGGLNFPWHKETINVYQEVAHTESTRYDLAKDAATAALGDPNPNSPAWMGLIANYSYVPYAGYLVAPADLRKWAFDQVYAAGYWSGSSATLPPSQVISEPYDAPY